MESSKTDWMRTVVQEYEGPLTRYARRITGDLETARDVVQDTFLKLHTVNGSPSSPAAPPQKLGQWLFTVCRNKSLDVLRKERRMKPLTEAQMQSREVDAPPPSVKLETEEAVSQVLRVFRTIPSKQQEVLLLKLQNGFSYKEIAEITNHSVTNVGFLIHTGLKTMREKMSKQISFLLPKL